MIDELQGEHEALRRLAGEIEAALGRCEGAGWDDRADCDLGRLRDAQVRFSADLTAHEAREKRLVAEVRARRCKGREELAAEIETAYKTLSRLLGLLRAVSSLCDGSHVYSVRNAAARVREELEAHFAYEEKVLFPLLRRGFAAR